VLPRGTAHRYVPAEPCFLYVVSSVAPVERPDFGLVGRHAVVDPRVLVTPHAYVQPPADWTAGVDGRWRIRVRRRGEWTTFRYPHNPFNAVGWAGDLAPYRLSVGDIRPGTAPGFHPPPQREHDLPLGSVRHRHVRPPAVRDRSRGSAGAVLPRHVDNDEVIFTAAGSSSAARGSARGG
jgi:homogentisate 1,2-dioxygenase